MKCKSCGYTNRAGVKFCVSCGKSLSAAQSKDTQICSSCDYTNRAEAKFCVSCGATLKEEVVSRKKLLEKIFTLKVLIPVLSIALLILVIFVSIPNHEPSYPKPTTSSTSAKTIEIPDFGDFSSLTEDEASIIGNALIKELYPKLEGITPGVESIVAGGNSLINISYSKTVQAENGSFERIVIVEINTEDGTISIAESN